MESLSRPPHRRKHSTSANIFSSSVSFKNPYDGVLLSNGGERKSLEAHEYSEIFSGSSSIPVLDLPELDERVGSGDSRDSKLDYSNIFGGFTNDDAFVPYEELLNDSAKKTKTKPRMPAESQPRPQESVSKNPSRKTKRSSGEVSGLSVDEVKKQINISFNKTNQRNGDASEGKTHVAQLHAVPAFTHFIDGTPQLDKTKGSQVPLLKREVSRTWSFSAEMGPVSYKGELNSWTSQTKDTSQNANEVNIKSQFTKMQPPSSFPSNLSGDKDPRQSPPSNFASKKDASQKMAGECSPPFFGEEFDENSVDAMSAAALKKAIEQAQESIRIAKMIMERKKECCQDGSKPRPIGGLKVSNAEAKIDRDAYVAKGNKAKGKHEEPDHIVNVISGIDRKFTPSSSHSSTVSNAANSEVERVWENVEADKEHGEAFSGKSKLFISTYSHSERLHNNDSVELEKLEKNVEATETQGEAKEFPGSVANAMCGTVELEPVKVQNINGLMPGKLAPDFGELGTEKEIFERRNLTVHHIERSEVIPGLVERAADTSERMQGKGKIVDEDELCRATLDHAEGSENMVERVNSTLAKTTEHYMFVDEAGDNLSSSQERDVSKQRENDMNHKKKIGELEEFNNVLDESCKQVGSESLKQEEMKKRTENDCDDEISGTRQKEVHICFESKDNLKESLLEEINKREHHTAPDMGEFEKKGYEAYTLEINDKKQDLADADGDEAKLAEVLSQNKVEEEQVSTCEYEADGTIMMEANVCAEMQKKGAFWDTNETVNALGGAGRSEGSHRECEFQGAAYEEDIDVDEAVEVRSCDASTIFDNAHTKDDSTVIDETQEASTADLNSKEDRKVAKNRKENETMPEVDETVSVVDQEKKAEQLFHLHDNEILGTKSLHQSASEEIFVDNKLEEAFEGLSSAGKMETVGVVDTDPEENLLKDENVSKKTGDIHDATQEYATKINRQNLPEELARDIRMAEFNFTDVRQVLEQTSESDEGSLSVSSSEKIEGLPADESDEFTENVKDLTSEKEEPEDQPKTISDERKCAEGPSEFSELHSEPKEMDKPKNTDRDEEKGLNPKTKKENLAGASPTEERDAKESEQNFESNDQQQRIEAIKRGREREKDRLVVERAIREARERAFADARERAERAAVEKAAAEARQRIMAEAKEKAEKATTEAKLRAERAAVERATAEARERALEKAMSQKVSTERVSSSSRNNGLKHSFSSSDLENGMNTESAQRRKARLERHQRIMERAAKALAEKNMRDLLAQKEQAERNRLAESLDADIKRWASGKEGNLRALLSTLQYILGPDSGWQPITLTEIITTVAVKKAYRKATLYVHPDKLQQRGASVQQKYVCEKVFDLLKAAWNRFNSDER